MARPIPCCAPVTSATFPFRRIIILRVGGPHDPRADYRARRNHARCASGQEVIAGRNVSTSGPPWPGVERQARQAFTRCTGSGIEVALSPGWEDTLSHFSREPKVVNHFSRGPEVVRARAITTPTVVAPPSGEVSPSARRFGE